MTTPVWIASIAIAYLLGSIPFGFLFGRARGVDIREHGSKNIGATNVGRVLGRRTGWVCLALDIFKGLIPTAGVAVLLGTSIGAAPTPRDSWLWLAVAVAAVLGHVFPLWLGFRGGKGVATAFGAMLGIFPYVTAAALGALIVWIARAKLTRYVSVSSIAGAVSLPCLIALWVPIGRTLFGKSAAITFSDLAPYLVVSGTLAALIIARHRANIGRLLRGEENRMPARSCASAADSRGDARAR